MTERESNVTSRLLRPKTQAKHRSVSLGTTQGERCFQMTEAVHSIRRVDVSLEGREERRRHYCRGCGRSLPLGFRGQFHKECLRADKRNRTREQRRQEQERFKAWLGKQLCPRCGARYRDAGPDRVAGIPCEASQPQEDPEPQAIPAQAPGDSWNRTREPFGQMKKWGSRQRLV
jgi:hypothetical protein